QRWSTYLSPTAQGSRLSAIKEPRRGCFPVDNPDGRSAQNGSPNAYASSACDRANPAATPPSTSPPTPPPPQKARHQPPCPQRSMTGIRTVGISDSAIASTVLCARRRPERDLGQSRAREGATGPQVRCHRLDVAGTAGRVRAFEGIVRAPSTDPPAAGLDPLPDHAVPRAHPRSRPAGEGAGRLRDQDLLRGLRHPGRVRSGDARGADRGGTRPAGPGPDGQGPDAHQDQRTDPGTGRPVRPAPRVPVPDAPGPPRRIEAALEPFRETLARLDTIPWVGRGGVRLRT